MNTNDGFESALAKRLGRLRQMPVDTSALERAVRGQIPVATRRNVWRVALQPLAAVAASVVLMVVFAVALQGRQVQASANVMAQMHREIVNGTGTMKVDSIAEANAAFAAFGAGLPTLSQPPESQTMACCMRNVGNKKVACVLFNNGSTPVTMAVADIDSVEMAGSTTVIRNGEIFHVQAMGELNMVMLDRNHHHICLIGAMPAERLMGLTDGLKF